MKKEDIEFLKDLQHEMLTQDKVCQASPRFWVVMDIVRDYWVNDDGDGIFVYSSNDGDAVCEGGVEDVYTWIESLEGVSECNADSFYVSFRWNEEDYDIDDINDLQSFLDEYNEGNYKVGEYREREQIVQNTMFLTLRECKEHIEANRHHYSDKAHSYAMTAYRSPQVAKLFNILENTDWNGFNFDMEALNKIDSSPKEYRSIISDAVYKGKMPNKEIK